MGSKILGLVAISVLLSTIVVLALSSEQYAEAKPVKMSPKHKYSKWTKKVCGDQLCPDESFSRTKQYIGKSKSPR
jgi:hypothetical protein